MKDHRRIAVGVTALLLLAACYTGSSVDTQFEIPFVKYTLDNGLDVVLHQDRSDPIVAIATLIHVGSSPGARYKRYPAAGSGTGQLRRPPPRAATSCGCPMRPTRP